MGIDDLWHLTNPPKDAEPCGEHGQLVASSRHNRGKRYRVRYVDPAGKVHQPMFAKKGDAERFEVKIRSDVARGEYIDTSAKRQSFREYAESWRLAQPHRPNTTMRIRSQLERRIYPALGDRAITTIRPSDVQAFVGGLSLELKPSSVRVIFATLSTVLGSAVRDRLIVHDPSSRIKLPQVARAKINPLTVEEVTRLRDAMPAECRALIAVAAGTGMRQGEVFGLQVRDVDFLRKVIRVERQVQPTGVGPLKNRAAYRVIPVGKTLIDELAAHLAKFPAGAEQFIFRTAAGDPLHSGRYTRTWYAARKAAGLPSAGMHDLRHFYASALIRAGLSVKVVSERLGHTNAAMTLNVYGHLWADDEDRTRQAIDELWSTPVKKLGRKLG